MSVRFPAALPESARRCWERFVSSGAAPANADRRYLETFQIGATKEDADQGAALVVAGRKTATSSLDWEFDDAPEARPYVGAISILEDGSGRPACVVATTWVEVVSYGSLTLDFVRDYGETLPSLEAWYAVFDPFYRAQCAELGRPLTPDTPLLCERFHMLFVPTPVGTG